MEDIEVMKQNLEKLQKENASLKSQIQLLKEKENSYQSSISRIKKIQNEYESSYTESINDYKNHEEEIKKKYLEFQKNLEKQNEENEKRLSDEIFLLKNELKEKDNIINSLKEKINLLNEKITKDELNYYFKEKEYEDIIISKERKLNELNEAIKQIVQEATEEIKRLSEQLEDFQNRTKINNPMNLIIEKETIENNYNLNHNIPNLNKSVDNAINNNINSIKSLKQNDIIKQSQNIINNSVLLSDNIKNILKDGTTPQKMNNSFMLNNKYNNLNTNNTGIDNNNPLFYTQNNFYNKNNPDIMTQLYLLQNDKNLLANQLKQKEKEVNFWKNLRSDLYANSQAHKNLNNNLNYNYNNNKYLNDIKLKNMEKTLMNYGNKINRINMQYNESLKNHQREIDKLKNDMENSINLTQNSKFNEGTFNTNSYEEMGDNNDNDQARSESEDILHALKITIPSKEGIRNEYINSQVQKIKNADNIDNNTENNNNIDNNDNIDNFDNIDNKE